MTRRRRTMGLTAIALLLGSMVGFFREREWGDLHLFIKHRPLNAGVFLIAPR